MGINLGAAIGSFLVPEVGAEVRTGASASRSAGSRHGAGPGAIRDDAQVSRARAGFAARRRGDAAPCAAGRRSHRRRIARAAGRRSASAARVQIDPVAISNWRRPGVIFAFAVFYFGYLRVFRRPDDLENASASVVMFVLFLCLRHVLGRLRTGRRLAQPVRRPLHRSANVFGWEHGGRHAADRSTRCSSSSSRRCSRAIWVQLGARNLDPSAPVKLALGLILMGVGFLRDGAGVEVRRCRRKGAAHLADPDLPVPHLRRVVPESRWA